MYWLKQNWVRIMIIALMAYFLGYHLGIGNQVPKYGDSGLPKNCRALIADNSKGFEYRSYTAEEALYSIDRNCGPNGLIWKER
jgi:hypothetical protein